MYCFDKLEDSLLGAQLVVEAVVEDLEIKQELFESKEDRETIRT